MGLFLYSYNSPSGKENDYASTYIYKYSEIGHLADNVLIAIDQEKKINQDIHNLKGKVSSNIGEMEFYQRPYWALYLVLIIFAVYGTCLLIDYIRKLLWIPVAKLLKIES